MARLSWSIFMSVLLTTVLLLSACVGGAAPPTPYPTSTSSPTQTALVIDPTNFVAAIDNPFYPLTPGMMMIFEGATSEGNERVETHVTHDTKRILGLYCVVVRDRVLVDDELVEETLDWYAQDKSGNVWYFGEDSREYEEGALVGTKGSWEAGVDGAIAGIIMPAHPQVGEIYRQEYYAGEAEDMAKVVSLTESSAVPYGAFDNLLMTEEWTPLEPGLVEQKYYAAGVGLVLEVLVQGGSGRVELVAITTD